MAHRSGLTLTEVLVAIFIMGIGMLSLLVLFPLAALKMNQAIKDQRTADCARVASAFARFCPSSVTPGPPPEGCGIRGDGAGSSPAKGVYPFYTDPNADGGWPSAQGTPPPALGATYNGPSYPVYVDPVGVSFAKSIGQMGNGTGFRRVSPTFITSGPMAAKWMSLLDEINFSPDGSALPAGPYLNRNPRYSWAYLCQQYAATSNAASAGVNVDLWVVVYDRRPALPGSTPNTLQEETVCKATFTATNTQAFLDFSPNPAPQIKTGTWVLDATVQPDVHGFFYRIERASPTNNPSRVEIELNIPARASAANFVGVAVLMDGVVEVFERGS
jgi:prepilin-type N-terminal cleavage/methylation domain-containing protein